MYRPSDRRHWEGLGGPALPSGGFQFQQWNVEAWISIAIFVRFRGERGGLGMKLTFFVSQASANFCDGPLCFEMFESCSLFVPHFVLIRDSLSLSLSLSLSHSQKILTSSWLCVAQPGRVREPTADRGRWSPQRCAGIQCSGRSWRKKKISSLSGAILG